MRALDTKTAPPAPPPVQVIKHSNCGIDYKLMPTNDPDRLLCVHKVTGQVASNVPKK